MSLAELEALRVGSSKADLETAMHRQMEAASNEMRKDINDLREKLDAVKQALRKEQSERLTIDAERSRLEGELAKTQLSLTAHKQAVSSEQLVSRLQDQMTSIAKQHSSEIAALRSDLETARKELRQEQATVESMRTDQARMEEAHTAQIVSEREMAKRIEEQLIGQLGGISSELNNDLHTLRTELKNTKSALQMALAEKVSLKGEDTETLRARYAQEMEAQASELNAEIFVLR